MHFTMKLHYFMFVVLMSFDPFQTLMDGKGDKATAEGMELLRKEVGKLKEELTINKDGLYPCTYIYDACCGFALVLALFSFSDLKKDDTRTVDCKTCHFEWLNISRMCACFFSSHEKLQVRGRCYEEGNGWPCKRI